MFEAGNRSHDIFSRFFSNFNSRLRRRLRLRKQLFRAAGAGPPAGRASPAKNLGAGEGKRSENRLRTPLRGDKQAGRALHLGHRRLRAAAVACEGNLRVVNGRWPR